MNEIFNYNKFCQCASIDGVITNGPIGLVGKQGPQGEPGKDGVTFTPYVSNTGYITWTNDGGRINPPGVYIMGPEGKEGPPGKQGERGPMGLPGQDGKDGIGLPEVTEADNGKFAVVSNGVWSAVSVIDAEGVKY